MRELNNKLHKEVYGLGECIVMLHGWAMHTGVWRTYAKALAENYQVICLDLPGHGLSKSVSPYTLDSVVEAVIKELPDQKCVIVGWSLGGNVALRLAEKYPQRIESLVLLACNPRFIQTESWPGVSAQELNEFGNNLQAHAALTLLRFMSLQVQGRPDAKVCLKQIRAAMQECPMPTSDVLLAGLNVLKTTDQRQSLSGLQIPILMILGEQDTLVPVLVGERCCLLQSRIDLKIIAGAGHAPFLTARQQLLTIMHDFIRQGDT